MFLWEKERSLKINFRNVVNLSKNEIASFLKTACIGVLRELSQIAQNPKICV